MKHQEIIWQVVASIPYGAVATYGQIAKLAGMPNHARHVGSTLKKLPNGSKLPWHRVVNSQGHISFPVDTQQFELQKSLLIAEGITLTNNVIKLKQYQWQP